MRKYISFLLTIFLFFLPLFSPLTPLSAWATNEQYACILSRNTYFYSREREDSGLFILPYTYYVKILSPGIEYCYVQYLEDIPPYQAVYGYCKTSELTFVNYAPARPYLYLLLDATYSLDDWSGPLSDSILSSVTMNYVYYGDYTVGSACYAYVSSDGKMGYLPRSAPVTYELNADYLPTAAPAPAKEAVATQDDSLSPVQITLLVVIAVLTVGAVCLFLFRKKPSFEPPEE